MNTFLDKIFRWKRFNEAVKHIPNDSVVCDLGCGQDAIFLKKIPNLKYGIGLDSEIDNFSSPTSNIEFKKNKLEKTLPLKDESCDVISMIAVIEHLSFPNEILKECFRCLKTGGKLIVTTPTPISAPVLNILCFYLHLIDRKEISDHKNYFWPKDIKNILIINGFKKENIKSVFFELFFNSIIIAKK